MNKYKKTITTIKKLHQCNKTKKINRNKIKKLLPKNKYVKIRNHLVKKNKYFIKNYK